MGVGPMPAVRKVLERRGRRGRRPRPRRAERGVRVAEHRRRSASSASTREGERQRRRDRARPSARDERRAPRRLAPARAAPPRRPLRPRDAVRRRRPGPGGAVREIDVAGYRVEKRRGFNLIALFMIRARLSDTHTGGSGGLRQRVLAEEAAGALPQRTSTRLSNAATTAGSTRSKPISRYTAAIAASRSAARTLRLSEIRSSSGGTSCAFSTRRSPSRSSLAIGGAALPRDDVRADLRELSFAEVGNRSKSVRAIASSRTSHRETRAVHRTTPAPPPRTCA